MGLQMVVDSRRRCSMEMMARGSGGVIVVMARPLLRA